MKKTKLLLILLAVGTIIAALIVTIIAVDQKPISGDVNADGLVDLRDVVLLCSYFADYNYDTDSSSVKISSGADMNGDGSVDLVDLNLLRRYLAEENFDDELYINEKDGVASVKTQSGLNYSASGYSSIEADGFAFEKALDISLDDPIAESFNRFTLKYRSKTALKIFVGYTQDGISREDYYFLESGEGEFSGVIPDFLDNKKGSKIAFIRVENLENKSAEFALLSLSAENASVPDRNYYIRGERYTLGIDLGWGGTVNYVSDNLCPIEGVTNMINKHDTGRLVQQSYYGTGAIEGVFEWGSFNGSTQWPYNPVQGGGQKNTASRLVDFSVDGNTVYVKVQPMDWGKSDIKYITPSYMENWFVIEEDYIRVDNRFVDFSGWEHPVKGQELPAFYTVSYLDSFVWYDGVEPWTGDELSWRHELNFWGDSQYSSECSFRIKEPNTETWCAWISCDDNYGIGLYSPNIDRYSAGRYQYNGSKDASANPTNYVAPWKQIQLIAFEPLEYSYLIAAGSVDEIRATFTEHKDVIDNETLNKNSISNRRPYYEENMESIDFTASGSEKFAVYPNLTDISFDEGEGALKLLSSGGDAYFSIDYLGSPHELLAEDYKYIEVVYMIPKTNALDSYSCQLFICADKRLAANESDSVRVGLIKDGNYHTLRVRVDDKEFWSGRYNLLRFDYFNGSIAGDVMYIRSVRLTDGTVGDMSRVDFSQFVGAELISASKSTSFSFESEKGATSLMVTGSDPSITVDYSVASNIMRSEDYSKLRITYMIPESNSTGAYDMHVFLCSGEITSPSGSAMIQKKNLLADGEYHTLEIDLSSVSFWEGDIHKIRLDYFDRGAVGDVFYIKALELVK